MGGGPSRRRVVYAVAAAALVILPATALVYLASNGTFWIAHPAHHPPPPPKPSSIPTFDQQVQHIFVIMKENHAYDSYFGSYCGQLGPYCSTTANTIPPGICIPNNFTNTSSGCTAPFRFPTNFTAVGDIPHGWGSSHMALNNGSMNGFVAASPNNTNGMGYYDGATIPAYWDWAEQYGLGDNFFSSVLSFTLPNHWYLVAGSAPSVAINSTNDAFGQDGYDLTSVGQTYLNQANGTPTIDDSLMNRSINWTYYDNDDRRIQTETYAQAIQAGTTWNYKNPLAAKYESYTPPFVPHFSVVNQLFWDLQNNTVPNVSYIIPADPVSEHPPSPPQPGMNWTVPIVNAIMQSSVWNSSVIFLSWDDYGGFYDHVVPPTIDGYGLSFRVPLLVIGPYVKQNFVSHSVGYFESFLKFIEYRYHLPSLAYRDQNAPNLLSYFNFSQAPRPPWIYHNGTGYPVPLQNLGPAAAPLAVVARGGPGSLNVAWTPAVGGVWATHFKVTVSVPGGPWQWTRTVGGNQSSTVFSGLPAGAYYASVQAVGLNGVSSAVAAFEAVVPGGALLVVLVPPVGATGVGVLALGAFLTGLVLPGRVPARPS